MLIELRQHINEMSHQISNARMHRVNAAALTDSPQQPHPRLHLPPVWSGQKQRVHRPLCAAAVLLPSRPAAAAAGLVFLLCVAYAALSAELIAYCSPQDFHFELTPQYLLLRMREAH